MSDELDPDLSRWFAAAQQHLPGTDFESRVGKHVHQSRKWIAAYRLGSLLRAAVTGIATGILTPFRLRSSYAAVMAAAAVAMLTVWIGLQTY
jgi:hypothetical protein